jgi:hypothetical protein
VDCERVVETHLPRLHHNIEGCIQAFREFGGLDGEIMVIAGGGSGLAIAHAGSREVIMRLARPV